MRKTSTRPQLVGRSGAIIRVLAGWLAVASVIPAAANGQTTRPANPFDVPPDPAGLALTYRAQDLSRRGRYAEAEPIYLEALETFRRARGDGHPDHALGLNNLAHLYWEWGRYDAAEPLFKRSIEIYAATLGERHPEYARGLHNLAQTYVGVGRYADAEPLLKRAIAAFRASVGERDPDYAMGLMSLGRVYAHRGDYDAAEPLLSRAAATYRAAGVAESYHFAISALADLHAGRGDLAAAERLQRELVDGVRAALGPDHPRTAMALSRLGLTCLRRGDYDAAAPLLAEAVERFKASAGENHPEFGGLLVNLAGLHLQRGELDAAAPLARQALDVWERTGTANQPNYARGLAVLGSIHFRRKDWPAAEAVYRRALDVKRESVGDAHPDYGRILSSLASVYRANGEPARAEPLNRQALDLTRRAVGDDHPDTSDRLGGLATTLVAQGRRAEALPLLADAWRIAALHRDRVLSFSTQREQSAYLSNERLGRDVPLTLAVELSAADPAARRAAAEVVLGDKGAMLEAITRRRAAVAAVTAARADAGLADLYDRWQAAGAAFTRAALAAPPPGRVDEYQARLAALQGDAERLEKELAAASDRMAGLQASAGGAGLDRVAAALPAGSALVEYARYVPVVPNGEPGEPVYIAVVIRPATGGVGATGGAPTAGAVDVLPLGPAAGIDAAVERWRRVATRPPAAERAAELAAAGEALSRLAWAPVALALGPCRRVYVSPDEALSFVPFAALPATARPAGAGDPAAGAGGGRAGFARLVLDDYDVAYVATGRDLVRTAPRSDAPPLIVGDVDFDFDAAGPAVTRPATGPATSPADADPSRREPAEGGGGAGRTTTVLAAVRAAVPGAFARLPGTRAEVAAVRAALASAQSRAAPRLLVGRDASESAVTSARRPSILHLATHGFYLPSGDREGEGVGVAGARGVGGVRPLSAADDPGAARADAAQAVWARFLSHGSMLHSGVALAGANRTLAGRRDVGGDDGILTAEEVLGMDLWGTGLVVVSACDSGVGRTIGAEGVYGLRRAFAAAGAHQTIMSLWSIDDGSTAALMAGMYVHLARGRTPPAALLAAQRAHVAAERQRGRDPHPFHWAAFVASGIGTGLEELPAGR